MNDVDHHPDIHVKVTNTNTFAISDRYDGVPYDFEPGHPVTIPPEAAAHIFGARPNSTDEDRFRHFQRRAGWNVPEKLEKARAWFAKIKFEPIVMTSVAVPLEEFRKKQQAA